MTCETYFIPTDILVLLVLVEARLLSEAVLELLTTLSFFFFFVFLFSVVTFIVRYVCATSIVLFEKS